MAGLLEAIWIKRAHRGPMDAAREATAISDRGLEGNADQGGKRQVTIVAREALERAAQELGRPFDPVTRRANLMVSGLDLENSRGRILRVGGLRIEIWGETRPCELMDKAVPGLRKVLQSEWRGGAYGVVLDDAVIRLGDEVSWA